MKDKHQKHPPLIRPIQGQYHNNEWAIYGTNCTNISSFYNNLSKVLSNSFKTLFVDADHNTEQLQHHNQNGIKQFITSENTNWEHFDDKFESNKANVVFVNGNHYPASRQIVIIDSKKESSLLKRVEQLSQIDCIVLSENEDTIYPFIRDIISDSTPIFRVNELDRIEQFLRRAIETPRLKALVLAGGKSKRMGLDKSQISYHNGQTQELYIANLCKEIGMETYISKSHTFESEDYTFPIIKDRFIDLGPFGAILSAQLNDPKSAWLVIACDLPMIDKETLEYLISQRNIRKLSTAYKIQEDSFPEPLIAIYEPSSYNRLLQFLSLGYACPRKMLINSDIKSVIIPSPEKAMNANTPEERSKAKKLIS